MKCGLTEALEDTMKTVLLVDDEKLFLSSLTEGLSAYRDEFTVATAGNGQQALEVLDSQAVDMVVTDLKMPVMDGFQLLANMMYRHPLVPVIVMTAFGTPDIEDRLRDFGNFGYLEKPIDFQNLADKVRNGLAQNATGHIKGITLFSFLQLLEMEKKTCTLKIKSRGRAGVLYLDGGELVNAICDGIEGEEAAQEIVCWEETEIEIVNIIKKLVRRINKPLPNILMEAAQMKDEAANEETANALSDGTDSEQLLSLQSDAPIIPDTAPGEIELDVEGDALNILNLDNPTNATDQKKELQMANNVNESIQELMQIDGTLAAILVDSKSGMALGQAGNGINLDVAAAGNSEVVKAKMKTMANLGLKDTIEDILISLGSQYHLIRPLKNSPNLFFYLVLNREKSNLAMARHKLNDIEGRVTV